MQTCPLGSILVPTVCERDFSRDLPLKRGGILPGSTLSGEKNLCLTSSPLCGPHSGENSLSAGLREAPGKAMFSHPSPICPLSCLKNLTNSSPAWDTPCMVPTPNLANSYSHFSKNSTSSRKLPHTHHLPSFHHSLHFLSSSASPTASSLSVY